MLWRVDYRAELFHKSPTLLPSRIYTTWYSHIIHQLSLYFPRRSKIWKEKGKRWHLITLWLSMCECSCNCRIELIKREESRTIVQKKKMVGIGKTIDTVCLNNIWLHLTFKRRCNGCIKWEIELRKPLSLGKSQRICKAVQRDARKTRKNLKYSMRSKELDYPC